MTLIRTAKKTKATTQKCFLDSTTAYMHSTKVGVWYVLRTKEKHMLLAGGVYSNSTGNRKTMYINATMPRYMNRSVKQDA
jgi:hypothetical protein